MKIVIQTGEYIGRQELEYFVSIIPEEWRQYFETIVVYGSREKTLRISYHEKEKSIGIHSPSHYEGSSNSILEEIAISLSAIKDFGHLPGKLPSSRRNEYKNVWVDLQGKGNDAT